MHIVQQIIWWLKIGEHDGILIYTLNNQSSQNTSLKIYIFPQTTWYTCNIKNVFTTREVVHTKT